MCLDAVGAGYIVCLATLCAGYRGSVKIEHTLAQNGSRKLWELMHNEPYVHSLGALTGMQAMQMVKGGLKAIYCSGWQVAADANAAAQVTNIVPCPVKRCCLINDTMFSVCLLAEACRFIFLMFIVFKPHGDQLT